MISAIDSIPTRSVRAKGNLDLIWTQFNDLNFFIEDEYKENFYLNLFRKLYPTIRLEKVFGLGGKKYVKQSARDKVNSKKDIHIVDLDFDHLLNSIEVLPNLFYLERYSIENYLIEHDAIAEFIKEEKTTIKDSEINLKFNLESSLRDLHDVVQKLSACCFIIHKFSLGIEYFKIEINRDFNLTATPYGVKNRFITDYYEEVKAGLKLKRPRMSFERQVSLAQRHFKKTNTLVNVPGKYLMNLIKFIVVRNFELRSLHSDNFNYRVGKNCSLKSLSFLKSKIDEFLN
ncbi:Protein of unknown function [Pedobacter sp. ok626]|uniref:DUF4435 domain-containing protein n=1 Tax=Pedobacter sp. ok626 TaxID=1761882 RepID=UPI000890C407|nr:DUF4435 domain-containing protein [Pedobacter sp. ok626]SDK58981.1 Protein of unknown function [Pedobacter sp. ok626]